MGPSVPAIPRRRLLARIPAEDAALRSHLEANVRERVTGDDLGEAVRDFTKLGNTVSPAGTSALGVLSDLLGARDLFGESGAPVIDVAQLFEAKKPKPAETPETSAPFSQFTSPRIVGDGKGWGVTEQWFTNLTDYVSGGVTATPDGSQLFVTSATEMKVHALRTSDGTKLWDAKLGGSVVSTPAVSPDGRTVFVHGGKQGDLSAFDAETGKRRWRQALVSSDVSTSNSSPTLSLDGERLFLCGRDNHLYCFDAETGERQ